MAMAKVIPIRGRELRLADGRVLFILDNSEEVMQKLRDMLYETELSFDQIAKDVGVSVSTLYAIRSGRTKWPRPNTMFGILEYLKAKMALVKS
jgi:predicted transcriptional regulator